MCEERVENFVDFELLRMLMAGKFAEGEYSVEQHCEEAQQGCNQGISLVRFIATGGIMNRMLVL